MLLVLRSIILAILLILAFVCGGLLCILRPRHRNNVHMFAKWFSWVAPILGIKVILRPSAQAVQQPYIYIANHQNTYDLFTVSGAIMQRTVTVGKKSLVWIPLFGQLYWITGNILIDRANRTKAVGTIGQVVDKIKKNKVSVWMFPEGTRSRGRGLLPFKTGAFHAAIGAQVPIVPIVCSSTDNVKLNRWNNGVVIVEVMKPITTVGLGKEDVRSLLTQSRDLMAIKLAELDQEVAQRNKH